MVHGGSSSSHGLTLSPHDASAVATVVDMLLYNGLLALLMVLLGGTWAYQWARSLLQQHHSSRKSATPSSSPPHSSEEAVRQPLRGGDVAVVADKDTVDGVVVGDGNSNNTESSANYQLFKSFQRRFLFTFILMATADWLQGAYVYRLYSYYGFTRSENGYLFIAGYGSSLVFGTWVGPIADRYGRRLCCILYGLTYMISCWTKFYNDYAILMVGRIVSGVATSILCSGFESWMTAEHNNRGFEPAWISETFSLMSTLNGLAAIASGFLAEYAVVLYGNHPVAPFGLAGGLLFIGTVIIATQWSENYGVGGGDEAEHIIIVGGGSAPDGVEPVGSSSQPMDEEASLAIPHTGGRPPLAPSSAVRAAQLQSNSKNTSGSTAGRGKVRGGLCSFCCGVLYPLIHAFGIVMRDKRVRLVGLIQSVFEGCMYTFVFMWSPSLEHAALDTLKESLFGGDQGEAKARGVGAASSASGLQKGAVTVAATFPSVGAEQLFNDAIAAALPYGIIFAAFMLGSSLGGTLFGMIEADGATSGGSHGTSAGEQQKATDSSATAMSNNKLIGDEQLGGSNADDAIASIVTVDSALLLQQHAADARPIVSVIASSPSVGGAIGNQQNGSHSCPSLLSLTAAALPPNATSVSKKSGGGGGGAVIGLDEMGAPTKANTTNVTVGAGRRFMRLFSRDRQSKGVGKTSLIADDDEYDAARIRKHASNKNNGLFMSLFRCVTCRGGNFNQWTSTTSLLRMIFIVGGLCFLVPVFSSSQAYQMLSFIVFEVSVGMFWPMLGVLRSQYLPEAQRATIINIFRIPLNCIVVGVLWFQGRMAVGSVFLMCALLMGGGVFLTRLLERHGV